VSRRGPDFRKGGKLNGRKVLALGRLRSRDDDQGRITGGDWLRPQRENPRKQTGGPGPRSDRSHNKREKDSLVIEDLVKTSRGRAPRPSKHRPKGSTRPKRDLYLRSKRGVKAPFRRGQRSAASRLARSHCSQETGGGVFRTARRKRKAACLASRGSVRPSSRERKILV